MRGLPDWGRWEERDGAALFAGHESHGVRIVLPDSLGLALGVAGRPRLHLLAVRPVMPMTGRPGYGRLDLELQLDSRLSTEDGAIRCAPALRAWVWLASSMLELPEALTAAIAADCSGLGFARLSLPLEARSVGLIESALVGGTLPILARAECEIAGIAARVDARADVDLSRLHAAFAEGAMTPARLAQRLAGSPASMGVSIQGGADLPANELLEALADHIRALLCPGPMAPAGEAGLALVPDLQSMARGRARLDLSEPVIATRVVAVALDPFAAARALAGEAGGIEAFVTRGQAGLLPTGRHELVVDASVARPCVGPLSLGASVRIAARPPARTHEVVEDFELPDVDESVARQFQLAPGEPLDWTLTGFAFWPTPDGRGAQRLAGPTVTGSGSRALLRPDAFPLSFLEVQASAALLALAAVSLSLSGARPDGGRAAVAATLTHACPRLTLALPADASSLRLEGELIAREGGGRIPLPARDATAWRLELSDMPGYGPRALEIAVDLPAGVALAAIEVLAEDAQAGTPPQAYAFTPAVLTRTHRWLCHDPFRPGLRWRWLGETGFSAPIHTGRLDLAKEARS